MPVQMTLVDLKFVRYRWLISCVKLKATNLADGANGPLKCLSVAKYAITIYPY